MNPTEAFIIYGLKAFSNLFPVIIEANEDDAKSFCCNSVVVGKKVIMNKCSDELSQTLKEHGFEAIYLDFSEFMKAGGSASALP